MSDARTFWDEKFAGEAWIYGQSPNDFLREVAPLLSGPVLCLGEGEGRNAVFLAQRGLAVTAVDASPVGLAKAQRLAAARGVRIDTIACDLADFDLGQARWGAIVSIWCHTPTRLRERVHQRMTEALAPGGRFVLEAYTPRQLAFATGGPKDTDLLVEPEALRRELAGLDVERLAELERDVQEGQLHHGRSAVVQAQARRPA